MHQIIPLGGGVQLNNLAPQPQSQFQNPQFPPQPITSSPGDIVLSPTQPKKSNKIPIVTIITILILLVCAGIGVFVYFSSNGQSAQPQESETDSYRDLADNLTDYEANLQSVYKIIEKGSNSEMSFYTFVISGYVENQDKMAKTIDAAKSTIPQLLEYLNSLKQSQVNNEIKNKVNEILAEYDSYSTSLNLFLDKVQSFKTAFLEINRQELEGILANNNVTTSAISSINSYEEDFSILKSDIEKCTSNSNYSVPECVELSNAYRKLKEITESDTETTKVLFNDFINTSEKQIISNVNDNIRDLRKLIEVELWQSKSE